MPCARPGAAATSRRFEPRGGGKTTPVLAETEQTALFNRFFGAGSRNSGIWWETGAWEQALWRLRALDRRVPGDFVARVTLAGVLLRLARFDEDREALRIAHDLRRPDLVPAQALLALLDATVGDMVRGRIVMDEILMAPALRVQAPALNNAAHLAFLNGDVEWLSEIAALDHGHESTNTAALLLATIEAGGLGPSLAGHQKIVRDLVCNRQCGLYVSLVDDGSWPMMVSHHAFLAIDRMEEKILDRLIFDRLADYYEAQKKGWGPYIPYLNHRLSAMLELAEV